VDRRLAIPKTGVPLCARRAFRCDGFSMPRRCFSIRGGALAPATASHWCPQTHRANSETRPRSTQLAASYCGWPCRVHLFAQCPDLDFRRRKCVGYDHRWDLRIEVSSSGLPRVRPWRLFLEKPQLSRHIEYLDPTSQASRTNAPMPEDHCGKIEPPTQSADLRPGLCAEDMDDHLLRSPS